MYVVAHHKVRNFEDYFARGQKLVRAEGAPEGAQPLEFYPSADGKAATCVWKASSVGDIQSYLDETLGDASENYCYEVNPAQSFAERPDVPSPPAP
jgi:hypothetical protein